MHDKKVDIEIYVFIIHANLNYHCILFENKDLKFILPFEKEIEEILSQKKE